MALVSLTVLSDKPSVFIFTSLFGGSLEDHQTPPFPLQPSCKLLSGLVSISIIEAFSIQKSPTNFNLSPVSL